MNSDAQSCANHWNKVVALCSELAPLGVAVYEHSYSYLSFGSWTLILGKRKKMLRFNWDGREGFVTIQEALVPDSRSIKDWKELNIQGIDVRDGDEPFAEVLKFARTKFAA